MIVEKKAIEMSWLKKSEKHEKRKIGFGSPNN